LSWPIVTPDKNNQNKMALVSSTRDALRGS
jgi:hypothetical protein